MRQAEKQTVIKAIADSGNSVTAADVASKTGISLEGATRQLNAIAAEAGGHLLVSSEGDIAYRFKPGFQTIYFTESVKSLLATILEHIWTVIFYLLKVSFGLFLIVSLFIVVICFSVITALSAGVGTDREDYKLGEMLQFFNLLIVRDLLFWGVPQKENMPPQEHQGNFFINCFSFLFGDGNPNTDLEERKWSLAARVIRQKGGIVLKEELAPYIGPDLDDNDSILPILSRFDGRPEVTKEGYITYIFPSLQVTTDDHKSEESTEAVPTYLEEKPWAFTNISERGLKSVYMIAGLNLFGTWWIYLIFNQIFHFHFVWTEVLATYGTLFVVIPTVRQLWLNYLNDQITIRNYERQQAAEVVQEPDFDMRKKLAGKKEFHRAVQLRSVATDHLVFTTEPTAEATTESTTEATSEPVSEAKKNQSE